MKKQLKYKGLTLDEVKFLQRENRKDFVQMLIGLFVLAAIVALAVSAIIGAMKA